jgi:hypothetical protein
MQIALPFWRSRPSRSRSSAQLAFGLALALSQGMTRSYGFSQQRSRPVVQRRRMPRDPSITNLGFACFRLIAIEHAEGESAHSWIRVSETRTAMMSLMNEGPSKRERFMRQISALDRVLQASLRAQLPHS